MIMSEHHDPHHQETINVVAVADIKQIQYVSDDGEELYPPTQFTPYSQRDPEAIVDWLQRIYQISGEGRQTVQGIAERLGPFTLFVFDREAQQTARALQRPEVMD